MSVHSDPQMTRAELADVAAVEDLPSQEVWLPDDLGAEHADCAYCDGPPPEFFADEPTGHDLDDGAAQAQPTDAMNRASAAVTRAVAGVEHELADTADHAHRGYQHEQADVVEAGAADGAGWER